MMHGANMEVHNNFIVIYIFISSPVTSVVSLCAFRLSCSQWRAQDFFSVGVQQIQLRTEDRENGDLGGGSPPSQGFWRKL